jgi:cytochrome c nitrite reductase small subunit
MVKIYILLSVCIGIMVGLGTTTFFYARGYSYLSDDPEACKNCHIMNDQYSSWLKSSHRSVATCNDCHTPKNFAGKWFTKGLNGWNHSYAFTSGDFHEPIQINKRNREIAEENCRYCHSTVVSNLTFHETENTKIECTSCHRSTGHMK